jgi:hypothetical protein
VLGALCYQRGLVLLHANAVLVGGEAMAVAGPSGAGKSTLAAQLMSLGLPVLCDDVCAIDFDAAGWPRAWAGVRRLKLWRDSIKILGGDPDKLEPVSDDEDYDKFSLPAADAPVGPFRLRRLYVLQPRENGAGRDITPLNGYAAASAVLANLYRWRLGAATLATPRLFETSLTIARSCEVFAFRRTWDIEQSAASAAQLAAHMRCADRA